MSCIRIFQGECFGFLHLKENVLDLQFSRKVIQRKMLTEFFQGKFRRFVFFRENVVDCIFKENVVDRSFQESVLKENAVDCIFQGKC